MTSFTIRRLEPTDDRSSFRSGNLELDLFFVRYAGQNQFRYHLGTTYVAIDASQIVGFATVAPSEISAAIMPVAARKGLPRYPIPVLRLARLATDERAVGRALLACVFGLAHRLANDFGCLGVVVDSKPEAIGFYEKLGFLRLSPSMGQLEDRPQPIPMFISLMAIG